MSRAYFPFREFTDAGGLISYGTNIVNTYKKAGGYVGRILKGAKPEELPIDQPSTFEMVINLKTAAAFNFDIPPAILAQSNDTIE